MVNKSVVISEEIANISDTQLQKRLKEEFNFNCGPITTTTKGIYIKKLQELINSNVTTAKSTPVKQTTSSNVPTPKTRRKTLATPIVDVEIKKPELPKPNRRASVGRSPTRSKAANKIEIKPIIPNFSDSETEDLVVNESKPNTSINGQTALEYSRGNRLLKRTINSRISSITPTKKSPSSTRSTTLATTLPTATSKQKQQDTIPRNDSFSSDDSVKKAGGVEVSYSVKKTPTSSRAFRLFNRTSSLSNYSDSENEEKNNLTNDKKEASSFTENITKRLLRHRPTFNSLNLTKPTLTSKDYPSTKYLNNNNQQIVSQVNQNDSNQSSSSYITQSNWIPKSILIAVILFFAFIFSFYFYSRFISSIGLNVEETELNALEKEFDINFQDLIIPGCLKTNDTNAICSTNQVRPVLLIIKEMKNIVDRKLSNYYCSSSENLKENPYEYSTKLLRNQIEMSIGKNIVEIARQLRTDKTKAAEPADIFLSLFANALDLLNSNSNLHMKPIGENGNYEKILIDSNYPKPLHATCQIKLFMYRTIWWFVILVTISGVLFSMYLYINRLKNEKNKEKEVIYDLVNKSIELLQSPDEPQSLPILHVRDMLLDPSQRKLPYYQRIWDEVVHFIENNESRVKSSLENIDGEDYKTWKWVAASKNQPDSTVMKSKNLNTQMNEWQNNVFSDDNTSSTTVQSQQMSNEKPSRLTINTSTPIKNNSSNLVSSSQLKDFVALTRFLKVRNMVDQQTVEIDDDWKLNLSNSIIEMCSKQSMDGKSHGIQHIHVDDRNDGLVYIKCDSIETASNAFKALHGTVQALQEKKFVSVKFLKEERYYNRFPEAENLNKVLKSAEI